ncbi:MAG: hypothetical protein VX404_01690 [Planctomycetota bacterium]|nr:hypothetical protein [Planctomycetota bacterium]
MNKSILLGLVLALMVPAVALADGVTVGGDLRLRWDYRGVDGAASANNTLAETYLNLGGTISDNVSWGTSMRHGMSFGEAVGTGPGSAAPAYRVQEAYISIGDLGPAASFLGGWSMELGRMNAPNQGSGRVTNSDNFSLTAGPNNADGYHMASEMGGIGVDIYYFGGGGSPAGSADNTLGASFDLGAMGGFADIDVHYWGASDAAGDPSNLTLNIDNIGGDNLAGLDVDVEYSTRDNDDGGDDGTLTAINITYGLGDMGMTLHVSSTIADADWEGMQDAPHGTNGIADIGHGGVDGADVDNTTVGLDFSPMEGVDATINYISLSGDASGDAIGTEIDLILNWACTDSTSMEIGYASYTDDEATAGGADEDFFYLGTGWSF